MNQLSPGPSVYHGGHFEFFRKFSVGSLRNTIRKNGGVLGIIMPMTIQNNKIYKNTQKVVVKN
jgi:hypothetical protein